MKLNQCQCSQGNFSNSSPALPAFWGWVFSGEKLEVLYVMIKTRTKRNKAGKGTDLKLYDVKFNI